jgi:23S rRNA pseudouridine1911/1915/1917 synthase
MELETIIILPEEAGERLDKVLTARFSGLKSRSYFQFLIEQGLVLVNGSIVKKRTPLKVDDEIEIEFALTPEINLTPQNIPLDILYEDEDILVINKSAGMVVHPAAGNWDGTLVNALLYHCKQLSTGQDLRPGIVHRLDKDTSGVLVAAKHQQAQQNLVEQFANRQVKKEYLAICIGNPGKKTIDAPIGRHPSKRQMMAIVDEGKPAISHCEMIKYSQKLSLVKVILETGRTHQIRVHMKHVGTPVVGDDTYGNKQFNEKLGVKRQMLHAQYLAFKHPRTGNHVEFSAPIPSDIQKIIDIIS